MDKIILIAAISELDFFPLTPARVIINEYIEISKVFATDKSQVFVNGILINIPKIFLEYKITVVKIKISFIKSIILSLKLRQMVLFCLNLNKIYKIKFQ
jgi:hypothetical protein